MMAPPDETYSVAEVAEVLRKSPRQVQRYLDAARLGGSRASGAWQVTALHIWQFQGIAEEMLESYRRYCREASSDPEIESPLEQTDTDH